MLVTSLVAAVPERHEQLIHLLLLLLFPPELAEDRTTAGGDQSKDTTTIIPFPWTNGEAGRQADRDPSYRGLIHYQQLSLTGCPPVKLISCCQLGWAPLLALWPATATPEAELVACIYGASSEVGRPARQGKARQRSRRQLSSSRRTRPAPPATPSAQHAAVGCPPRRRHPPPHPASGRCVLSLLPLLFFLPRSPLA